jgi:hypothetical protein
VKAPWTKQIDQVKSDLELIRRQIRLLTGALRALAERVRALEDAGKDRGPPEEDA